MAARTAILANPQELAEAIELTTAQVREAFEKANAELGVGGEVFDIWLAKIKSEARAEALAKVQTAIDEKAAAVHVHEDRPYSEGLRSGLEAAGNIVYRANR